MDNKKKIYKIIVTTIIIMIIISIAIPIFLDLCIWGNSMPSNITNSDWSSFLGSFLGGILGSIGSLIGIYITIFETRNVQQENACDKKTQINKEKLDLIIELSSEFYREIKFIQKLVLNILNDNIIMDSYQSEIQKINEDISQNPRMPEKQLNELNYKSSLLKSKINFIELNASTKNNIDCSNLTHAYFMLTITLKNIMDNNSYLSILEESYKKICTLCDMGMFDESAKMYFQISLIV